MTDTSANQLALIIPSGSNAGGRLNQVAIITPLNETPPASEGANVNQLAIISVGREYEIPLWKHGYLIRAIWGDPLLIERNGL